MYLKRSFNVHYGAAVIRKSHTQKSMERECTVLYARPDQVQSHLPQRTGPAPLFQGGSLILVLELHLLSSSP